MAATDDVIEKGELEDTKVETETICQERNFKPQPCRRRRRMRSPTTRRERERRRRMSATPAKMTRRSCSFR